MIQSGASLIEPARIVGSRSSHRAHPRDRQRQCGAGRGEPAGGEETLADLALLSRTLATRSTTIDSGLADAARTAWNTARITDELPQLVQRVERSADAFDRMARQLGAAGTSASGTIDDVRGDLRGFTGETLPEMRELVAELRELTTTMQRIADKVERNPSTLLFNQPATRRGPGE